MAQRELDNLVRIGHLKAEPGMTLESDDALLAALLRVAAEVSRRAQQLGPVGGSQR